jgi:microcompartment protein CcmK/EutM
MERDRVIERAVAAYRALADLAETVEDEWQYVTDVIDAYTRSLIAMASGDGARPLTGQEVAAVDEAIAEIGLISDAQKSIDWLSTFPNVVALALGVDLDRLPDAGSPDAGSIGPDEAVSDPDDDSPFRLLLGGDR